MAHPWAMAPQQPSLGAEQRAHVHSPCLAAEGESAQPNNYCLLAARSILRILEDPTLELDLEDMGKHPVPMQVTETVRDEAGGAGGARSQRPRCRD
ncbi:hypothetical protein Cadr_000000930 [Camelus dromedarius]|uniref:Uncharacterized protein n=1 Tax=Camelus dromedarius TaxID=9838 RepID=A0A5N4EK09_CAMDR|nr:hypothetical protein Cadr_000000930 [Camelus dromedarius]